VETQSEKKPWNVFSYMSLRIIFIGSTNFLVFVGPRPSFGKTLVSFDPLLDLTRWSKKKCPGGAEITDLTDFEG
jgi:hypothetical protein